MVFHVGDPVVHWTYGLGKVAAIEERALAGQKTLYYAVEIHDLTVWVPADDKVATRLRPPTSQRAFKKLFAILSGPGSHSQTTATSGRSSCTGNCRTATSKLFAALFVIYRFNNTRNR